MRPLTDLPAETRPALTNGRAAGLPTAISVDGAASGARPDNGAASGAVSAVEELFRRFASRVYGYVRLRTDPETADDVVADTFVAAWRLRERVPEDPLPWLLVIARHALANRNRASRRAARLVSRMATVELLAAAHAPAAGDIAVHRQVLLAAVGGLDAPEREALLLTAWDGLTARDAARVAGCTERTLRRRLVRARARLDNSLRTADAPTTGTTTEIRTTLGETS